MLKDVQSPASERKHLHILNGLSGTIDSKGEWRNHTHIYTYSTNIWVLNPVYKYRFIDFPNYWLNADSMWPKQIPGEYVLMRVTVCYYKDICSNCNLYFKYYWYLYIRICNFIPIYNFFARNYLLRLFGRFHIKIIVITLNDPSLGTHSQGPLFNP